MKINGIVSLWDGRVKQKEKEKKVIGITYTYFGKMN